VEIDREIDCDDVLVKEVQRPDIEVARPDPPGRELSRKPRAALSNGWPFYEKRRGFRHGSKEVTNIT